MDSLQEGLSALVRRSRSAQDGVERRMPCTYPGRSLWLERWSFSHP